ncbi:hypothetical protein Srubr_17930 [Streptomyces rubradiris]|uniref:Uncharacterized protein n=1 Tax=Streptomyces rubradiris TaxID=285531 RepID=A0ABQ3R7Z6_STRRR|nr:hypothetical protein Srubr_17930 [Streptomyces rubradiris]
MTSAAAKKGYGTWQSLFSGKGLHKADTTADAYAHSRTRSSTARSRDHPGPWEITNFYKGSAFKDKKNLGIATVPAGSTGKAGAPTGGHNLSVYAGSDKAHRRGPEVRELHDLRQAQETIALKNSPCPPAPTPTPRRSRPTRHRRLPGRPGRRPAPPALPSTAPCGSRSTPSGQCRRRQGVAGQGPGHADWPLRAAGRLRQVSPGGRRPLPPRAWEETGGHRPVPGPPP